MIVADELASIALDLIALDRRLDALHMRAAETTRRELDALYARFPFHPGLGTELARLARIIEAEAAVTDVAIERENERAIIHAKVA